MPRPTTSVAVAATIVAISITATTLTPASAQEAAPTWSEVVAARGDAQTTAHAVTALTTQLASEQKVAAAASAAAADRGREYQLAQDNADQSAATLKATQNAADRAEARSRASATQVAQWVRTVARTGGRDATSTVLSSGNRDDLLSRLSTATKLSETTTRILAEAVQQAKTTKSLIAQAQVASRERFRRAQDAAAALKQATLASVKAATVVREQQARQEDLRAKLSVLRDRVTRVEDAFAVAERARKAAAEKVRLAALAAQQAATSETSTAGSSPSPASTSGWTMPITSYSGYQASGMRLHPVLKTWRMHAGADFSASCGTSIYAASAGTVTYAGPYGDYGNLLTITTDRGVTTRYAHMFSSGVQVQVGQRVSVGQPIAQVGNAGLSTGCHLHFEIRPEGATVDPVAFLSLQGVNR